MDLQPDNIMFPNKRSWNVKLLDTGTAVRIDAEKGEAKVERLGAPEYSGEDTGFYYVSASLYEYYRFSSRGFAYWHRDTGG